MNQPRSRAFHTPRRLSLVLMAWAVIFAACGDDSTNELVPPQDMGADVEPDVPDVSEGVTEDMGTDTSMVLPPDVILPDGFPDIPDDVEFPVVIEGVETTVNPTVIRAGEPILVTCQALDAEGMFVQLSDEVRVQTAIVPETSWELDDMQRRIATRVGEGAATCSVPAEGLIDTTPATFQIVPGAPHTVLTSVDTFSMRAGDSVTASCQVFDVYGNPIDDAVTEVVTDSTDGVVVTDNTATITRAGFHTITCRVNGATVEEGKEIEVVPSDPASLAVSLSPDQLTYAVGQVITLNTIVTDIHGNTLRNADVTTVANPMGEGFGSGRFRFSNEGTYTLTATVQGAHDPSVMNPPLERSVTVIINSTGPQINCDIPGDGVMINHAPGTPITFQGSVADTNGVQSVLIDNQTVMVDANGNFSMSVNTRFGINFVDITANDQFGEQNSRTCAFLVSDRYRSENSFLNNGVALRLEQAAFDDGNRMGNINSLADMLDAVLNSPTLVSSLEGALMGIAGFPTLVPNTCLVSLFGGCLVSYGVEYRSISLDGPNDTTLDLITDGLQANVVLRNLDVNLRLTGTVNANIGIEDADATVDITFDVELQNGSPSISVRSVNNLAIRNESYNIGLTGINAIDNVISGIITGLFRNTIRGLLESQLRSFIETSFNDVLDGLLSSLDISTLGTSLPVPRLDGTGTLNINFGLNFSSLSTTSSRFLAGIGTRFTPQPVQNAAPSLGIPLTQGSNLLDYITVGSTGAIIYIGLFNQLLHALWRGGLFDATIDGAILGDATAMGLSATLQLNLPPVAILNNDGSVSLQLGGARLVLNYPSLLQAPLVINLGAVARASVTITPTEDIDFGNIVIDELFVSTPGVSLDNNTRMLVEGFMISLVNQLLVAALNDALPALPIPSFTIPASVSMFGLPANAELGLVNPTLTNSSNHIILDSDFGLR